MDIKNVFRVGRIAGIEIGVHVSWLLVFVLVSWSLAVGYFPATYPGLGTVTYWWLGVVAALGLFASVLLHELAHSLVARARGVDVNRITLFIFGGVSNLTREPPDAKSEFLIAVVGPLSSLVLGGVLWLAHMAVAPAHNALDAGLAYLSAINVILGLFNLLPGFPLDGGRILRSIVWAASGSLQRATAWASYAGQAIGYLMIFWGATRALSGAFLDGLWTAFIGWFLTNAAEAARQSQAQRATLGGVPVSTLMDPRPATAAPDTSVQEFVFWHLLRRGHRALPVVDDGRLVGIVTVTDVKEVPQPAWPRTRIAEVMTPAPLRTVAPNADLAEALQLLASDSLNQVPVVEGDRLVGMLNRADVLRYLQIREELHIEEAGRARTAGTPSGGSGYQRAA
jgi:Zn-dependent protease/CBS domain-containing protein